jgi:hypothetical protein
MKNGCNIKGCKVEERQWCEFIKYSNKKEWLQILKKWKGGGEGNDVKWFPININEIENEWKLHSMRWLWPLHGAL